MFARAGLRTIANARGMATEASGSSDLTKNLLDQLATVAKTEAASSTETANPSLKKKSFSRGENKDRKTSSNKPEFRNNKKTYQNNRSFNKSPSKRGSNYRTREQKEESRGFSNSRSTERKTVSDFDRYRNKKSKDDIGRNVQTLNDKGMKFAEELEEKAFFIRRKTSDDVKPVVPTFENKITHQFINARINHYANLYASSEDKFAEFKNTVKPYRPSIINKLELNLSKDKIAHNTESRFLKALEQITMRRGFKLLDSVKRNVEYLPQTSTLYPYANNTLPSNLKRSVANLKNLQNISAEEVDSTIASVVKGIRPELIFDPTKSYKTPQLKVNAQVVVNGLNRNPQLQVDNLHVAIAPALLGESPVKFIPQPVIAPMQIK